MLLIIAKARRFHVLGEYVVFLVGIPSVGSRQAARYFRRQIFAAVLESFVVGSSGRVHG